MEYTELQLLSHANAILDAAAEQSSVQDMKLFIFAAQHKLDLLKEILE